MQEDQIDGLIRQGQISQAQEVIRSTLKTALSREQRLKLAGFCRRTGLPEQGLRLLRSYVRPGPRTPRTATDPEKIEYAANLVRLGAAMEALEILAPIPAADALLFSGFAHIHQWEYAEAIPYLRQFLENPAPQPYQKLVARVNLAACLVQTEQVPEAAERLERIIQESGANKNLLLLGNALELSAQNAIAGGDYAAAEGFLREAENLTKGNLHVEKWRAILELKAHGRNRLKAVQERAAKNGDAETIRDCDFHQAIARSDERLFHRLYFGTPYESYRRKIRKHCAIPECYVYEPLGRAGKLFDLSGGDPLKFLQVPHRLLRILAGDLYKSHRIPAMHAALFPGRHFHPDTSVDTLHQALKRLRSLLNAKDLPIEIQEKNSSYFLHFSNRIGLRYTLAVPSKESHWFGKLKKNLPGFFSSSEAAALLDCSKRSAISLLTQGIENALLERQGLGKNTKYRVLS